MLRVFIRNHCCICGGTEVVPLLQSRPLPVFQGCTSVRDGASDLLSKQYWDYCSSCGTSQLRNLMPLDVVYSSAHAGSAGSFWDRHHFSFASFISEHVEGDIFEIGGGVGKLAKEFRKTSSKHFWFNLEPNLLNSDLDINGYRHVKGFLDSHTKIPHGVSTIVLSHCLEHMYSPNEAVKFLAELVPSHGNILISWPILESWVEDGSPGALNFEHTFFCTLKVLESLFNKYGLMLEGSMIFDEKHSIFLRFKKYSAYKVKEITFESTEALLRNYFDQYEVRVKRIIKSLMTLPKPYFLMPASIYSQYLYAYGLKEIEITAILDNALEKQGKRLYGTNLISFPMSRLAIEKKATVLLNAGFHNNEIFNAIKKNYPNIKMLDINSL